MAATKGGWEEQRGGGAHLGLLDYARVHALHRTLSSRALVSRRAPERRRRPSRPFTDAATRDTTIQTVFYSGSQCDETINARGFFAVPACEREHLDKCRVCELIIFTLFRRCFPFVTADTDVENSSKEINAEKNSEGNSQKNGEECRWKCRKKHRLKLTVLKSSFHPRWTSEQK